MKIGRFHLPGPFLLAPMAGITDKPFRRLCRRFGAGMTTSEMTTADVSLWRTAKSRRRLDLDLDCEPRVVQIAGSVPSDLALAAIICAPRSAQIFAASASCEGSLPAICTTRGSQSKSRSSRRRDFAVRQRLTSAVVISEVVMPAPKRRQSLRNGLSVMPAIGASRNGLGRRYGPIFTGCSLEPQFLKSCVAQRTRSPVSR